ncbi:MAG: hypothetical protein QM639_12645 [Rhodocyclaceae bacterium]
MSHAQWGAILVIAGIALALAGWAFFRKPPHKFWTLAPANRANEYMKPPGVALWWAGIIVTAIGVASCSS